MNKKNQKAVKEICIDGTIKIYKSIQEAANVTGFNASTISRHCNLHPNKKTISSGSIFCFVNDWNKSSNKL